MCVYICIWEKDRGLFPPPKISALEREELALSCMEPGSPLCPAHPPCCRTCFEEGVHIKKSIGMKSTFEVLWQKTKGWITLPGPGLLLGPELSELSWCCRRSLHQTFKAPPISNTQILPPEWSSRVIHEVSVRFLCTRKSTVSSGWTLRTKTNQFSLLKLLTLAEQIFQEEPKGVTDMDTLTLGQQVQHIPHVHSSHSWPGQWLWVSTGSKCQN